MKLIPSVLVAALSLQGALGAAIIPGTETPQGLESRTGWRDHLQDLADSGYCGAACRYARAPDQDECVRQCENNDRASQMARSVVKEGWRRDKVAFLKWARVQGLI
ncbi:Uu.00g069030.m01.CDS01 [Anthostomella pinea]|uniref:Uu.00g069030.m01.CDS01 n=1 Tax=Anthostomella pinea TaxID=933095 RepID=A0AAI8VVN0_9PEZI|nr:Uu.00g069030.m01.CDS01 [Anthostomella pinea]